MTNYEFRDHLSRLGLGMREFADLIDSNERTVRRWLNGQNDIPGAVSALLQLMTSEDVDVVMEMEL